MMRKLSFLFAAVSLLLLMGCSKSFDTSLTESSIDDAAGQTVTIMVTVENGIPVYYDEVNKPGSSFVTNAGYGTQVIWKLDPKSGLNEITDVTLNGDLFMLAEKPRKLSVDTWVAKVGNTGKGEVSFSVTVGGNDVYPINSQLNGQLKAMGPDIPFLRMP